MIKGDQITVLDVEAQRGVVGRGDDEVEARVLPRLQRRLDLRIERIVVVDGFRVIDSNARLPLEQVERRMRISGQLSFSGNVRAKAGRKGRRAVVAGGRP